MTQLIFLFVFSLCFTTTFGTKGGDTDDPKGILSLDKESKSYLSDSQNANRFLLQDKANSDNADTEDATLLTCFECIAGIDHAYICDDTSHNCTGLACYALIQGPYGFDPLVHKGCLNESISNDCYWQNNMYGCKCTTGDFCNKGVPVIPSTTHPTTTTKGSGKMTFSIMTVFGVGFFALFLGRPWIVCTWRDEWWSVS